MADSRLTSEGTHQGAFTPLDWGLLLGPAVIWGSSFFLIEIGLRAFEPMLITGLRVLFGFLALSLIPAARTPVDRADLPRLALLSITWMAFPLSMFSISEQWISSSVAGMLNAAMPLFTTAVATVLLRRAPGRYQIVGLGVGFVGVVLISLPTIGDGSSSAFGVGLVIAAVASYGVSINLAIPLQQKYGSLPMFWRIQCFAMVVLAPFALASVPASEFEWPSLLCCIVLGALGTGLAFVMAGNLAGRVGGPTRLDHHLPHAAVVDLPGRGLPRRVARGAGGDRHARRAGRCMADQSGRPLPPRRPTHRGRDAGEADSVCPAERSP